MNETLAFLVRHGALFLFIMVFIEQIGIPIPATPFLLAAGALVAAGQMNWAVLLGSATVGSLLADLIWYQLGRARGTRVLGLLCRISIEPDSCVRSTQDVFSRYGRARLSAANSSQE
jgi:membrane protein DedA with SNARE-associated domain